MAEDKTPLQKLDEAISDFVSATGGDTVSGWIIGWQEMAFTDEVGVLPILTRPNYTFGSGTTLETASGLSRFLTHVTDAGLLSAIHGDEGEED